MAPLPTANAETNAVLPPVARNVRGLRPRGRLRLGEAAVPSGCAGLRHAQRCHLRHGSMGRDAMGQCLAEDRRLPFRARANLGSGVCRPHDGDRGRAVDQHGQSSRWQTVSAPRPRHPGFFQDDRWLALHPFPHVAQSRRAAGEPCQSTGEGLAQSRLIRPLHPTRSASSSKKSDQAFQRGWW